MGLPSALFYEAGDVGNHSEGRRQKYLVFALTCQSRHSFQGRGPSCGHPHSQKASHTYGRCSRQLFEESSCQREAGVLKAPEEERGLCSYKDGNAERSGIQEAALPPGVPKGKVRAKYA